MTQTEMVQPSKAPHRNIWIVLALLIPATLLAFAPSYFKGITFSDRNVTTIIHVHAALMAVWLLMLIAQAWFVRTKQFVVHRWVGRSSFVIVPLIIVMSLLTTHESLSRDETVVLPGDARFVIYDLLQMIGFGLAWMLGIMYRRKTPIHVRYMVSTIFAMGNAIMFRILLNWFTWIPVMNVGDKSENIENVAMVNGVALLLLFLTLIARDWQLGIRRSPFWLVTATTALIHIGFFTFTKTGWWMAFVQWFADLPV